MIDTLYETIGGRRTVQAAIEAFYRRVLEDEALRPFFNATDMAHLRAGQSMFVSMLLGGKTTYTGREIAVAHAEARARGLTPEHFEAFLRHFRDALAEAGVNPESVEKVIKLLESRRDAVVRG